ncbi:MAG TPA: divalent-cation tolerance protein CutA [Thermodesulfovibrionales bacterium]|nr:divalent-cation tolerance protein CutA [Thermodesulfovibrionales bacterium]
MDNIVVFITTSDEEEAAKIAHALVEARLAGCANIVGGLRSVYRWEGRIEDEAEVLIVVKTRLSLFEGLSRKVRELHSYKVPEIIAVPVVKGSADYLKWLKEVTD